MDKSGCYLVWVAGKEVRGRDRRVEAVRARRRLLSHPGRGIEHGLFVALDKSIVLVGRKDGVTELEGVTML